MKNIPYLVGDRYDGLSRSVQETLQIKTNTKKEPVTFHTMKHTILLFLSSVYDALFILSKTMNPRLLSSEQLMNLVMLFLIVLIFQLFLSLT